MRAWLSLAVVLLAVGVAGASGEIPVNLGVPDEALRMLFTPPRAPEGVFRVFRSARPAADLAGELKALDPAPAPGAWELRRLEIGTVFGSHGTYDPGRLGRLFKGRRAAVVRGSLLLEGRRYAFVLVSPHPDPTLTRIVDGTLTIVIDLTP
jgi:hypothetical protein